MKISESGLEFIAKWEGCRLVPYLDASGVPTIGIGFTHYLDGTRVSMHDKPLTQEECDAMFAHIVEPYCNGVIRALGGIAVTQKQLDALTSFAYNCGVGAFQQSSLLRHIKDNTVVESDFTIYCHSGGKVLQGLLNRRKAEYTLFISNATPVAEIKTMEPNIAYINSISVNYTHGADTRTVDVGMTEELLAALRVDPYFTDGKYDIQIMAAKKEVAPEA